MVRSALPTRRSLIILAVVFSSLIVLPRNIHAQNEPPGNVPGAQAERFKREAEEKKKELEPKKEKAPEMKVEEAVKKPVPEGPSFTLSEILVTGVTLFAKEELRSIYQPYIGKKVTYRDLEEMAERIKALYKKRGYLTTIVYVPQQEIVEGKAELRVIEGVMGRLFVEGNKRFSTSLIQRYIHERMGRPLNLVAFQKFKGNETTFTTTNLNGGTIEYSDSALAANRAIMNWTYTSVTLKINGSGSYAYELPANITCAGINIASGKLDATTNNRTITCSGDWTNAGTFTPRSGTATFNGTDQQITGSTTFNNVSKTDSSNNSTDLSLTFAAGSTTTISGLLTLTGIDADDRVNVKSSNTGTQWKLNANGTFSVTYVEAQDSDASGGLTIQHANSINGGNNKNWSGWDPDLTWVYRQEMMRQWLSYNNWPELYKNKLIIYELALLPM